MELVYNKIVEVFNAHPEVFTQSGLPVPRTIDIDMGQAEDPESFEIFLPGIFVNWSIAPGTDGPDILTLDVSVLQEPGAGTESFSERITEGLEYMRLLKAIKYLLNKLSTAETSPLVYAGERPAATPFFKYHIISYKCGIDQYTDTIHRPQMVDGSAESLRITQGRVKIKPLDDTPVIETY